MNGGGCIGNEAGNAASGFKGPLQAGRRVWTWSFSNWEPWEDSQLGREGMSFTLGKGIPSGRQCGG